MLLLVVSVYWIHGHADRTYMPFLCVHILSTYFWGNFVFRLVVTTNTSLRIHI